MTEWEGDVEWHVCDIADVKGILTTEWEGNGKGMLTTEWEGDVKGMFTTEWEGDVEWQVYGRVVGDVKLEHQVDDGRRRATLWQSETVRQTSD